MAVVLGKSGSLTQVATPPLTTLAHVGEAREVGARGEVFDSLAGGAGGRGRGVGGRGGGLGGAWRGFGGPGRGLAGNCRGLAGN
jgi:hypothetical protein